MASSLQAAFALAGCPAASAWPSSAMRGASDFEGLAPADPERALTGGRPPGGGGGRPSGGNGTGDGERPPRSTCASEKRRDGLGHQRGGLCWVLGKSGGRRSTWRKRGGMSFDAHHFYRVTNVERSGKSGAALSADLSSTSNRRYSHFTS